MKNAPPESVTVGGWTAYAAMQALRRRIRLLEAKRDEMSIAADEEHELCAGTKALNEIVDCLFPCAEAAQGHDKNEPERRFSIDELLSIIQIVLPEPIILRAGYEDVPKASALYVLRAEMKAARRQLDTALSLRESRRAAQQRKIFVRLRQWWRFKCLVSDDDGAAGDWEETATQRLVEICRHAQALRPQPRTSTQQHPWR
ncbi:hypothetical protein AA105894_2693 [Asaia spathodeae NBRC 105894]|nr:hypothetical protein AA105894_2693 [Asaia spathodeae NBRC 105894]